jgi:pyridoxal phosphate enzyme (YggS family)
MLEHKFYEIQEKVSDLCRKIGRNPEEITIVGATKSATVEQIQAAIKAGLTHIAENQVQSAQKKYPLIETKKVTRHMIGHLQTNKVKVALQVFDVIQSVDSLRLAKELERQAAQLNRSVGILIEVNCSGEDQKFGLTPSEALPLIEQIAGLAHLRILGLMTMAPFVEQEDVVRKCFRTLREIYETADKEFRGVTNVTMRYLSMGMTQDYPLALQEGANMIRIGRALFGERAA